MMSRNSKGRIGIGVSGVICAAIMVIAAPLNGPPVAQQTAILPTLDTDPKVDRILRRACADCHSDQTRLPWYAHVPPASWLIARDIARARADIELSTAPLSAHQKLEMLDALEDGSMPPRPYRLMHPEAALSPEDLRILEQWAAEHSASPPGIR